MTIRRFTLDELKKLKGRTNKSEVDALTDKEIAEAALSDSDSALPTDAELEEFRKPKKRAHRDD